MANMDKVVRIIPDRDDGFMKNVTDLIEEYRKNNLQCMMLCFRRKDEKSTRTYFIGADDPHMFMTLKRLEHDILGIYSSEATNIQEYSE